jgi:hypothetical protein
MGSCCGEVFGHERLARCGLASLFHTQNLSVLRDGTGPEVAAIVHGGTLTRRGRRARLSGEGEAHNGTSGEEVFRSIHGLPRGPMAETFEAYRNRVLKLSWR